MENSITIERPATDSVLAPQSFASVKEAAEITRRRPKLILPENQLAQIVMRIQKGESVRRIAETMDVECARLQFAIHNAGISVQAIVDGRRKSLKEQKAASLASPSEEIQQYMTVLWRPQFRRVLAYYAYSLIHNRAAAEDIVQEALLKAHNAIESYKPEIASLTTWTKRILHNAFVDHVRRNASKGPTVSYDATIEEPTCAELPSNATDAAIELEHVMNRLMVQLPPDQQKILKLNVFNEHTHEQIAEMTGLPLGTVKSKIRLAREKLKDLMENPTPAARKLGYGRNCVKLG